ncbi:26S proteasome non-ATPase regulatory subunit 10-like [Balamuthia mandrillaris]
MMDPSSSSMLRDTDTDATAAINSIFPEPNPQKDCCLVTCGHVCSLCRPIVQQLLYLCQSCMTQHAPHPDLIGCIRNLLPVVADNNIQKFSDYLQTEQVEWVKEFVMYMTSTFGSTPFLQQLMQHREELRRKAIEEDVVLCLAAGAGKSETLAFLLQAGANPNGGGCPASCSCSSPSASATSSSPTAAEDYSQPTKTAKRGHTALHFAAHNGHEECVDLLLSHGADRNARDEEEQSPLHAAAHAGKLACLRLLLNKQQNTNRDKNYNFEGKNENETQSAKKVTERKQEEIVEVDAQDKWGDTALHKAIVNGHTSCALVLIKEGGANANAENLGGDTPFRKAIYHGHTACAKMLIEQGAEYKQASEKKISALHLAVFKGHVGCAALLLDNGAEVDYRDESDMTPLFFAAVNGHSACIELLLKSGADVNARDNEGKTALHTAARKGFAACTALLLQHSTFYLLDTPSAVVNCSFPPFLLPCTDAKVNAADEVGWRPLHEATSEGNVESVSLLLQHGAEVDLCDYEGCTPLHLAARCGGVDCLRVLLERTNNVNPTDVNRWTPLHEAANEGNEDCLQLLLQHPNIDIAAEDAEGDTALHKAIDTCSVGCCERLLLSFAQQQNSAKANNENSNEKKDEKKKTERKGEQADGQEGKGMLRLDGIRNLMGLSPFELAEMNQDNSQEHKAFFRWLQVFLATTYTSSEETEKTTTVTTTNRKMTKEKKLNAIEKNKREEQNVHKEDLMTAVKMRGNGETKEKQQKEEKPVTTARERKKRREREKKNKRKQALKLQKQKQQEQSQQFPTTNAEASWQYYSDMHLRTIASWMEQEEADEQQAKNRDQKEGHTTATSAGEEGGSMEQMILRFQLEAAQQSIIDMERELERRTEETRQLRVEREREEAEKLKLVAGFLGMKEDMQKLERRIEELELLTERTNKRLLCVLCRKRERRVVLLPCAHLLFCRQCMRKEEEEAAEQRVLLKAAAAAQTKEEASQTTQQQQGEGTEHVGEAEEKKQSEQMKKRGEGEEEEEEEEEESLRVCPYCFLPIRGQMECNFG